METLFLSYALFPADFHNDIIVSYMQSKNVSRKIASLAGGLYLCYTVHGELDYSYSMTSTSLCRAWKENSIMIRYTTAHIDASIVSHDQARGRK
jgi:hypothetical protein